MSKSQDETYKSRETYTKYKYTTSSFYTSPFCVD